MKQRVINGNALEFFDSSNTKKGEIKIVGSDIIINPLDGNGTVIFGEQGTVNDIEVGAVGTPVDFTFAGGGAIVANGGTLTIGDTGDTLDLSKATIGAVTASAFVGGTFEGNGAGLTGVIPDLSQYNGDIAMTGSLVVTGRVTAEEFHTEFVSSSIIYQSGSTKFGDTADDGHDFTGTLYITGSTGNRSTKITDDGFYISRTSTGNSYTTKLVANSNDSNDVDLSARGDIFFKHNGDTVTSMTLRETGNVGIGTTAPIVPLDVEGTVRIRGNSTRRLDLDSGVKITGQYYSNNSSELTYLTMYNPSNASINMGTKHSLGYISFEAGSGAYTERMRITNTGNVGIGKTNPLAPLDVAGNIYSDGNLVVNRVYSRTGASDLYLESRAGYGVNIGQSGGGSSMAYFDHDTLNVGIGTTTPSHKLHVSGTYDVVKIEGSGSANSSSLFEVHGNNGLLFAIDDDLSDSLFSVNTVAGLPVIEAFSDNRVVMGAFNQNDFVISGSNIGIGTDAPSDTLTIHSPGQHTKIYAYNAGGSGHTAQLEVFNADDGAGHTGGTAYLKSYGWGNAELKIGGNSFRQSSSQLQITTGTQPVVFSTGNIGIGTTSPSYKLDVVGSTRLKSNAAELTVDNTTYSQMSYGSSNYFRADGSQATVNGPIVRFQIGGTEKARIHSNGNVGIGTTSPSDKLHIADSDAAIRLQDLDGTDQWSRIRQAGSNLILTSRDGTTNGQIYFQQYDGTTTTDAMVIRSSGRVGIGTSSPAETFHVSGSVRVDGAGTGAVQEQAGSSPTTAYTSGDVSFYMGQPDRYLKIVIDGTTYVIPAYIPA